MHKLKIIQVGNSLGVTLPDDVLSSMNINKGYTFFLIETKDGYTLTTFNPEFKSQLESAEKVMKKYQNALKELAN